MSLLGAHVPVAGGLHKAAESGRAIAAEAIQIFTRNQVQWRAKPVSAEEAEGFRAALSGSGVQLVMAHGSYLINLAAVDEKLLTMSRDAFVADMERCHALGIPYLVFHPGAHLGRGEEAGLAAIAQSLDAILERTRGLAVMPLVEVTAGQGTTVGYRFEHIAEILTRVVSPERLGVCLDTCHLLAAGYDLTTAAGHEETCASLERIVGFEKVKALHLNDAKKGLGSRLDRHAPIGTGALGLDAFRRIVNEPRLAGRPMVVETPGPVPVWKKEVALLREMRERLTLEPRAAAERMKALAIEGGFDRAGLAQADAPAELAHFASWVASGAAGTMAYLTDQVDKRSDLRRAFPWARSILCVALQYDAPFPYSTQKPDDAGWIARYAWGDDYHDVMKAMLESLAARLVEEMGPLQARTYVDTGPIVERAYAAAAGLGAWGKNTCLLEPELGSWFFLGEIVLDLDLPADTPRTDMCGTCTACLDACPTGALPQPFVLDATRCISYLTIETKGAIDEAQRAGVGAHVFGCDICQDVCPWNRRRRKYGPAPFAPREGLVAPDLDTLAALDDEAFRVRFRKSPVKRAKRRGLLRNVAVAMGNSRNARHRPALTRLADDPDPVIREHAAWALRRIDEGA